MRDVGRHAWILLACMYSHLSYKASVTGMPVMTTFNDTRTHMVHICMITAYREHSYVQDTSKEILSQIKQDGLRGRVTLSINSAGIVVDNPLAISLENRVIDHGKDCLNPHEDTDPLPPCAVRQQGLDVANALSACYHRVNHDNTNWIIMMEDDFMPCEHAFRELLDTLDGLNTLKTKFARFTQGGEVVAFPLENVLLYALSIMENIATSPHDRILLLPWSSQADVVFNRHLFKHIGNVSTIMYRNDLEYVRQYSGLRDNSCGDVIQV